MTRWPVYARVTFHPVKHWPRSCFRCGHVFREGDRGLHDLDFGVWLCEAESVDPSQIEREGERCLPRGVQ